MSFGTIASNQNAKKKHNYFTWIQTALKSTLKHKTFMYTL